MRGWVADNLNAGEVGYGLLACRLTLERTAEGIERGLEGRSHGDLHAEGIFIDGCDARVAGQMLQEFVNSRLPGSREARGVCRRVRAPHRESPRPRECADSW